MNRRITSIILLLILMGGLVKYAFVDFDAEKSDSTIAQKIIQKEEVPDNTLILDSICFDVRPHFARALRISY